jgi:hypothetical protein
MLFDKGHLEKYLASSSCLLSVMFILMIVMQGRPLIQQ